MQWLEQLLKALGINPLQLRWRIRRYLERSRRRAQELENRTRSLSYQHKICGHCGLTMDAHESCCPRCDTKQPGLVLSRLGKLWDLLVPSGTYTVSSIFIVSCVAFYLVMLMQSGGMASLVSSIDLRVIIRFGAWTVPLLAAGHLWRLVTPIFLHFHLLHILFNCLWLLQLGPLVEELYGRSRFLFISLLSGVLGFAVSVTYRWSEYQFLAVPGAGASGVVFGLIAVALVAGYLKKSRGAESFRAGLIKWALYGLVFSLLPGVDLAAHLGGAVGGGLAGWICADRHQARRISDRYWLLIELLCWATIIVSFSLVIIYPGLPTEK